MTYRKYFLVFSFIVVLLVLFKSSPLEAQAQVPSAACLGNCPTGNPSTSPSATQGLSLTPIPVSPSANASPTNTLNLSPTSSAQATANAGEKRGKWHGKRGRHGDKKGLIEKLIEILIQILKYILGMLGLDANIDLSTNNTDEPLTSQPSSASTTTQAVGQNVTQAVTSSAPTTASTTTSPTTSSTTPTAGPQSYTTCTTDLSSYLGGSPGLSGAIVKNGQVVCTAFAGTADENTGLVVNSDTPFTWASVSKTVTATALMMLYDQGKFQLDDDISSYIGFQVQIPSCPGTPVTFRQLLTHTSSIKDSSVYGSLYVDGDSPIPLSTFIPGYLTPGGQYYDESGNFVSGCPGSTYDYSNVGAGTIGYLVEKISGVPFEQFTKDNIFTPLGMDNTSFKLADMDQSIIAKPNGNQALEGFPTFPDGTLRTSPANLGKIMAAYMNGGQYNGYQLLQSTTVDEMLKSQTSASSGQGLIWYQNSLGWGHSGSDPGISSEIGFDPDTKVGVLLVANSDGGVPNSALQTLLQEASNY